MAVGDSRRAAVDSHAHDAEDRVRPLQATGPGGRVHQRLSPLLARPPDHSNRTNCSLCSIATHLLQCAYPSLRLTAAASFMMKCFARFLPCRASTTGCVFCSILSALFLFCATNVVASLEAYDAAITNDTVAGLVPVAKLTNPATLTGANRVAFDFGNNSGDVTIEFVLQGNPAAGSGSAYLAVGANASSNLRYEQFNNTGQLGFTQLGVLDYLFSPVVPSPPQPTHIAYVWNAATLTMTLYLNGSVAGVRSGVTTAFAMPTGAGWLGANPGNGENMTGTIYRVTVYDEIISDDAIQRHADAYNDV